MSALPPEPTLDHIINADWYEPRKPRARHRAPGRPRTGLHARTTRLLRATHQAARDALTEAIRGTDTPAGGLALSLTIQRAGRTR